MAQWRFRTSAAAPLALALGLVVGTSTQALADFDDGLRAYEAGDYDEAMSQWLPLAEDGSPEAQFRIGQMFEQGQGVPASLARAAMWYRLAAGQDFAAAQPALDGVLNTLRAREASQNNAQLADDGAGPAPSSPGSSAPGFEPDRDIAYATPGQEPARVGDVDQPAGVPGRDAAPIAPDGSAGSGDVDVVVPPSAVVDDGQEAADASTPPNGVADDGVADDGVADAADLADAADGADQPAGAEASRDGQLDELAETDVADAAAADAEDAIADEAGIGDVAALDDDVTELEPLDDGAADAGIDDAAIDDAAIDDATGDALVDEPVEDLAMLDEGYVEDVDPTAEAVEDDAAGLDGPMPPELADALADGTLSAEEIDALVEDGVVTDELVDDLVEAGMLDEQALAELAEAGVLDEAALDALVDNGLLDETMVDDAYAALAEEGDAVSEVEGAVGDLIGDGIAQLFDVEQQAAEPERRLITARQ